MYIYLVIISILFFNVYDASAIEIETDASHLKGNNGLMVYVRKSDNADTNVLMHKAYNALVKGNNEAAIQIYKQILASDQDNDNATIGLATAYQMNKELSSANKLYVQLIKNGNTQSNIIQNLSHSLYEQNSNQSLELLTQLYSSMPNSDILASQIAIFHMQRNNNPEAISFLKKAIALSPSNISHRYNLGVALERSGEVTQAQNVYAKALEILENKKDKSSSMDSYSLIHSRLLSIQSRNIELRTALHREME